jgi:hypothetical protein
LLQDSLSPIIENLNCQVEEAQLSAVVPDIQTFQGLSKNNGVSFYALFNDLA